MSRRMYNGKVIKLSVIIYLLLSLIIMYVKINKTTFDVLTPLTGRKYHLTDDSAGSKMWIDLINAMRETQRERLSAIDVRNTKVS